VPDRPAPTPGRIPDAAWDTFTADVTIRRHVVKADGTPRFVGPEMRYRWQRRLENSGWKSTMTLVSASPDTVVTEKGPRQVSRKIPISRLEFGGATTPAQVFDADGRLVFMLPTRSAASPAGDEAAVDGQAGGPTDALRTALARTAALMPDDVAASVSQGDLSREWIEQRMPAYGGRAARRAALVGNLGGAQGVARGLDRFVSHRDGVTTEILSDPAWAVPMEVNVARDGRLVSHTSFNYLEDPGAGLVRRRMRSELLLSPESGERTVVDLELANIRLTRGGAR
jgi:hypothetical protein